MSGSIFSIQAKTKKNHKELQIFVAAIRDFNGIMSKSLWGQNLITYSLRLDSRSVVSAAFWYLSYQEISNSNLVSRKLHKGISSDAKTLNHQIISSLNQNRPICVPDIIKDVSWIFLRCGFGQFIFEFKQNAAQRNIPELPPRYHVYESRQTDGTVTPLAQAVAEEQILQKC